MSVYLAAKLQSMTQLIVIDRADNSKIVQYIEALYLDYDFVPIEKQNRINAFAISKRVNDVCNSTECIILLNLHLNYSPEQELFYGLEILKEIRVNPIYEQESKIQKLHVVLFSLFSVAHLLKSLSAEFILVASPAVSFMQMPLTEDKTIHLEQLAAEKIWDVNKLKPYFKVSDTTVEERHGHANWWSATRFLHHFGELFPKLAANLKWMDIVRHRNKHIRDAQFLYADFLTDESLEKRQNRFRKKFRYYWSRFLENGGIQKSTIPKIALIDDQAKNIMPNINQGWGDYYSLLLFGRQNVIDVIDHELSDREIINQLDDSYDCILVDLMLSKEDKTKRVDETRGAKLLKQIKRKYPMLPVVVTTASNKAEKRKILRQMGCDAFWIKEGIEEKLSTGESLERFLNFTKIVSRLTSREFSFLKNAMSQLEFLENNHNWWENSNWKNDRGQYIMMNSVTRAQVFEHIYQSLLLIRTFFQNQIMGEGFRRNLEESVWFSGVIVKLTTVIEHIHGEGRHSSISTNLIQKRGDHLGALLYKLRHKAAHYRMDQPINYRYLETFIKGFLCYLSIPYHQLNIKGKYANDIDHLQLILEENDHLKRV